MDFLDDYADLIIERIFILNAIFEGTAGLVLILVPTAVFTRLGGNDAAKAMARFYGLVMFAFSIASVLFSKSMPTHTHTTVSSFCPSRSTSDALPQFLTITLAS